MDSAQTIGHWKVVDSEHWTLDSIENRQKIGQSPADSNWTVSVGKKLKMQRKLITRISLTLIANNNFSVTKSPHCWLSTICCSLSTVQCPVSTVRYPIFFCPKTFSSSFSEDSGQWTKTVNSSPGQGVL